ncbi:MAG: hypothetical protein ACNI25_03415 [Halarcobacter sp.]
MKKLLLSVVAVFLVLSGNLFAIGNNTCQAWESGGIVYDNNGQQLNVAGQSSPAFCWHAAVAGLVRKLHPKLHP